MLSIGTERCEGRTVLILEVQFQARFLLSAVNSSARGGKEQHRSVEREWRSVLGMFCLTRAVSNRPTYV